MQTNNREAKVRAQKLWFVIDEKIIDELPEREVNILGDVKGTFL